MAEGLREVPDQTSRFRVVLLRQQAQVVDLGPAHASDLAAREAAGYASPRPLEHILTELAEARSAEQPCLHRLTVLEPRRDAVAALVAAGRGPGGRLEELRAAHRQALG